MKRNRLFEIVYILLDKEKVTAKELAEHFEVSTRTIYRDVEDLSAGGIPIYMTKGKNGGISLLPEYILNKTVLTEEDKTSILSSMQALNALDEPSVNDTLSKLSLFFGKENQGYYEIDFSDWGNLIKDQFEKAKLAIVSKKQLSFDYLSSLNSKTKRAVEPYKLWFKEKNWYLKAYCLTKNEMRIFRFSRMRNVGISEETFKPRVIEEIETNKFQATHDTIEIVMNVDKELEYRVIDEFLDHDITQNDNGSFTVKMNCIEDIWLYGYILSFGSSGAVISPLRLREKIGIMLKEMLENYENKGVEHE